MSRVLNREWSVTLSVSSNHPGDLSRFCSVFSVIREESEVEGDLETAEVHQFEPVVASDSSAESDQRQKMTTLETKTPQQRLVRICMHHY